MSHRCNGIGSGRFVCTVSKTVTLQRPSKIWTCIKLAKKYLKYKCVAFILGAHQFSVSNTKFGECELFYLVYGVLSDVWNFAPRSKKLRRSLSPGEWMPCSVVAIRQKNAFASFIVTVPLKRFQRNASIIYWNGMAGIFDRAICNRSTKSKSLISRINFEWNWSDSDWSRLNVDSFGYARPSTVNKSSLSFNPAFIWFGLRL